jgi:hypothetical protein
LAQINWIFHRSIDLCSYYSFFLSFFLSFLLSFTIPIFFFSLYIYLLPVTKEMTRKCLIDKLGSLLLQLSFPLTMFAVISCLYFTGWSKKLFLWQAWFSIEEQTCMLSYVLTYAWLFSTIATHKEFKTFWKISLFRQLHRTIKFQSVP